MTTTEIAVEDTPTVPVDVVPEQVSSETPAATAGEQTPAVELRYVDPRQLIIGVNTRTKPDLPKWFVDDIQDRGVREPIPVREEAPGRLVVRKGQRRTLASVEVWNRAMAKDTEPTHKLVPVLVEPELITDDVQREIDRIIDQLGENEHREGNTDADEVRATQELLDLGLSAGQIAKRRHIGTKRVKTAVAVARSAVAVDLLATGEIENLVHAAVIAEFEGNEAAVKELKAAATKRPEQFDHVAQQWRDKLEEERIRAELADQVKAQGVAVIERPDSLHEGLIRKLDSLRPNADAADGTELTVGAHQTCPGHAAFVGSRGSWRPVAERYGIFYVCTDVKAHGHPARYSYSSSMGAKPGPMTAEQKAERKQVVANNKKWRSAETVRRKWLKEKLFGRKGAPKDGIRWVAQMLADGSHPVRKAMESDHALAIELLGMPKQEVAAYYRRDKHVIAAAAANASPARATTLTVALLVAALEKSTGTHTWRGPTQEAQAYFTQLKSWGYPLSPVEQLVLQPAEKDTAIEIGDATDLGVVDDVDIEDDGEPGAEDGQHEVAEPQPEATDDGAVVEAEPQEADEVSADLAA
ncbi:chromosome partitioning protein ParB [Amycolatopsis sp. NPDC051758]|uniref:chromosome partitioning protein ParB n=1 Tax=Amycolatopsis sp. NPDC051758 TaxID=3363935 RepID=UPI0037996A65